MAQQLSSKQRLALAMCHFLSASAADGTLTADDKDSFDVAVSCIAESFKVDPAAAPPASPSLLRVFEAYLEHQPPAAAAATAAAPSDDARKRAEALKSRGNAAMAHKDYAAAADLYTHALALHPDNAVFLSNRAAAHSAAKDNAAARDDAEAAVAADPAYSKAWSRLGLARFALGDARGAMDAYARGIEAEGGAGSDAMRKGYETAKRRVDEMDADDAPAAPRAAGAGAGAGAMPDLASLASMFGGGGGGPAGGGMPDFSAIMNNPMFAGMAQNLMSNPDLMNSLMSNPRLRDMANQVSSGGGMPDLGSLMSDPNIADMARSMMGGAGRGNSNSSGSGSGSSNPQS